MRSAYSVVLIVYLGQPILTAHLTLDLMKKKHMLWFGLILFACGGPPKEPLQMAGAYTMLTQEMISPTDTTETGWVQQKIYTDHYMMYVSYNPEDSTGTFGIGSYTAYPDSLVEHAVYTASDSAAVTEPADFTLHIEKTDNGFKQQIPDMEVDEVHYTLNESYQNTSADQHTPLDGAWKMTSGSSIMDGDTTTMDGQVQYKVYYAGHFQFGTTALDSAGVLHTNIGMGTFTMPGEQSVKENLKTSTYPGVPAQGFDISIKMDGPDAFTQSFTLPDGTVGVESYARMK